MGAARRPAGISDSSYMAVYTVEQVDRPAVRWPTSDFTGVQIAVLFVALTLLVSIPVWTHPLPPLSDYVNHLARMHIIATVRTNADLARFYEIDWQIIPNLAMDLIVPLLGQFTNIYLAGQIFTVGVFALIMSGTLALNRALVGRWSVLPFLALPLLYNYVFLVGLMNYMFGVGLALWAMAVWIWLRERPWPIRLAVSAAFAVALFFCHLSALGIYGIGLLAYELLRLWSRGVRPATLVDFTASGLAFVPAGLLLMRSPTLGLVSAIWWEPRGKINGLVYIIELYSDIVVFAMIGIVGAAAVFAVRHRLLRIHPFAVTLLGVGTLVYMAMPRVMFATYMADQRIPIAVAFMLIACVDLKLRHRLVRRGFVAILFILITIRLIEVDVSWSELSSTTKEFRSSVRRIKPGSKVFVVHADRSHGEDVSELGLVHAACLAIIDRSAIVTTAFTVAGKQILRVRENFRNYVDMRDGDPPSVAQLVLAADHPQEWMPEYWRRWMEFDYVYVLFTEDEAPNPDPARLKLVQDGDKFQLYRVIKPN